MGAEQERSASLVIPIVSQLKARALNAVVVIRSYEARDHDEVVAFWKEMFPDDPPSKDPALMIRRKLTVQPELFLVGYVDGHLVATALEGFDGVRGWVRRLLVRRSHRRQGIARALMAAAEEGLAKLGCSKLNLRVRSTNVEVISFFRALGYSVDDRVSLGKNIGDAG